MPRTRGNAVLHRSQVDALVEMDEPLLPYPPPVVGEVERAIARHVAGLVPDGATVQVGVGAIPQAVLEALDGHVLDLEEQRRTSNGGPLGNGW